MYEQISIFEMLEAPTISRFTNEIMQGSGYENGRVRIYCASCHLDTAELAEFMKEEYGTGGHSATFPDGVRGFADHSPKGIFLRVWKTNETEKHSWTEAAREVKRLILRGEYLTDKDRLKVQELEKENGGAVPMDLISPRMKIGGVRK